MRGNVESHDAEWQMQGTKALDAVTKLLAMGVRAVLR